MRRRILTAASLATLLGQPAIRPARADTPAEVKKRGTFIA